MERLSRIAPLIGRILLSIIFLLSGIFKLKSFGMMASVLADKGMPAAPVALGIAVLIEIVCGLALLSGVYTRLAALVLFLYLIPVTAVMHAFWSASPSDATMQMTQFLKNLAIMGGLLLCFTSGPESSFFKHKR